MTSGRTLPWLQPLRGEPDVWDLWEIEYRDVLILGPENEPVAVFNLTEKNLADANNYATLKQLLLDAAE